jgi:hypothetical protein
MRAPILDADLAAAGAQLSSRDDAMQTSTATHAARATRHLFNRSSRSSSPRSMARNIGRALVTPTALECFEAHRSEDRLMAAISE